jgi:chromosome segregation ATPase
MEMEGLEASPETGAAETSSETFASDASSSQEVASEWDGNVESLLDQPWVPESAKTYLSQHLDDYTMTRTRADFLNRMFEADDRTSEMTRELSSLRQAMDAAAKERDEWRGRATEYETKVMEVEEEKEFSRLQSTYPDIFDDCKSDEKTPDKFVGAWPTFLDLLVKGYDEDTAARLSRALISNQSAPTATATQGRREVQLPPSVAAASKGGNNPSSTVNAAEANESFEQRVRRMQEEARSRGE